MIATLFIVSVVLLVTLGLFFQYRKIWIVRYVDGTTTDPNQPMDRVLAHIYAATFNGTVERLV
jgi:uncharacterized membrane protein YjgN (DUF898 family)